MSTNSVGYVGSCGFTENPFINLESGHNTSASLVSCSGDYRHCLEHCHRDPGAGRLLGAARSSWHTVCDAPMKPQQTCAKSCAHTSNTPRSWTLPPSPPTTACEPPPRHQRKTSSPSTFYLLHHGLTVVIKS